MQFKIYLTGVAFVLFLVIFFGIFWLLVVPGQTVGLILAFAAGLSMIFLPCTLPLVLVLVPLTMGQKPLKGILMALVFGLGISLTLAFYGLLTAFAGSYLGLDESTRIMFTVAGVAALIFGLSQLKLINWKIPGFSRGAPQWIQKRKDYLRTFFLGLFLGNAGIGCPNPAFYVLLGYIATTGSLVGGAQLGFVHGLGRAVPLLFLVILAMLGVNATSFVAGKKQKIDKIMGWALIVVGAFILTYGIFGMPWWEDSIFHQVWNNFIFKIVPKLAELKDHPLRQGIFKGPLWAGWSLFLGIIFSVILWAKIKHR